MTHSTTRTVREDDGDSPVVSLTVVTRNRCNSLRAALDAVQRQSFKDWEVVIVDNDSQDNTVPMVKKEFPWARVIKVHRNIGCQPGRNIAMANCRGEFIFNLDDDGVLAPDAVEQVVATFRQKPDVGLVAASVRVPDDRKHLTSHCNGKTGAYYTSGFIGAAHALRRSILQNIGYFPEYVRGYSEPDLALRMLNAGWALWFSHKVVMYHEVSLVERDARQHHYFFSWHELETCLRLEHWSIAALDIAWKLSVGSLQAARKSLLVAHIRGIVRFLCGIPNYLSRRTPVSRDATLEFHYLQGRGIADRSMLPDFSRATLKDLVRWKLSTRSN